MHLLVGHDLRRAGGVDGRGVSIAVLDSGIDAGIPVSRGITFSKQRIERLARPMLRPLLFAVEQIRRR